MLFEEEVIERHTGVLNVHEARAIRDIGFWVVQRRDFEAEEDHYTLILLDGSPDQDWGTPSATSFERRVFDKVVKVEDPEEGTEVELA